MPSPSDVAEFRQAQATLSRKVQADLTGFWATLNLDRPESARDALLRFIPVLTTAYGEAAATVAADWYDDLRASEGVAGRYTASLVEPFPAEYVQARVRYGAGHLFTDTPSLMLPFLAGAVQEYALNPARMTVARASVEDPKAAGWHRETRGAASCDFCRMLAGRGGVYRKETAHFASHGHCNCVAVPSWDASAPEVPTIAYVASQRVANLSPDAHKRHTARVREYLAGADN